jgi:peptide/nickel transport system permease protein
MRRLLRRIAWLIARLLLVVALLFFVVAKATQSRSTKNPDFSTDRLQESRLPLFFDIHPSDLESRVNVIVEHLSRGPAEDDERELRRLGAACLPLLVPRLAQLPETPRHRVAWALLPIAQRMTWRGANEVTTGTRAYDYFLENWRERGVDFQPTIVTRWVERLATRGGSALTASVLEYDTYALPALMAALPEIASATDVDRARHLLSVARHVTGLPWAISGAASPAEAHQVVDHWKRWWHLHAVEYTVVRGPSRWSAMLRQTQFGQWLSLVLRFRFGTTVDGHSVLDQLIPTGLRSLTLLCAAATGAIGVAFAKAWWARSKQSRVQLPLIALILASIPHVTVVAILSQIRLAHSMVTAAIVACALMVLVELANRDQPSGAGQTSMDGSTGTAAEPTTGRRAKPYFSFASHAWPFLLTLVFVIEKAFDVNGIGLSCINAFRHGDLHLLMAITTMTALWLLLVEFAVQLNRPSPRRSLPTGQSP